MTQILQVPLVTSVALVAVGTVGLVLTLGYVGYSIRGGGRTAPAPWVAFLGLLVLLLVSIPVGVVLAVVRA